jgi:uncharacterized repeat protein (TIGR03803 family)
MRDLRTTKPDSEHLQNHPPLRTADSMALAAGCVAFLFAPVLTLSAQPGNPIPAPPVQLPTPVTVSYSFSPATNYVPFFGYTNPEGAFCTASLIQDGAGRLYGVAPSGGNFGGGTVFSVRRDGTDFTVLHTFSPLAWRPGPAPTNPDGSKPTGLILAMDGWLYGTTAQGGTNGSGAVFRLSTDGASFTNIHNFAVNDGENPQGGLVQGPDGTLYGTAENGGTNGSGTVFRLRPDGSGFAVLYHFTPLTAGTNADGTQPFSGLILAGDGTLYGAARYGGPSGSIRMPGPSPIGSGTLFSIRTNGADFTILHAFTTFSGGLAPPNADGASPVAALTLGNDGRLYGTAPEAGPGGSGTLFRLDPDGSNFKLLHPFGYVPSSGLPDASYGLYPYGGLTLGSDGLLYGAAYGGGIVPSGTGYQLYFAGTLYRLNPDGTSLALLHSFSGVDPMTNTNSDGANSYSSLLQASDGRFYGLTSAAGTNGSGTLFSFAPPVVLQVGAADGLVFLTWPASATNFVLETSDTVAGTGWTPLTNGIITISNNFRLTLPSGSPAAFFRLYQR